MGGRRRVSVSGRGRHAGGRHERGWCAEALAAQARQVSSSTVAARPRGTHLDHVDVVVVSRDVQLRTVAQVEGLEGRVRFTEQLRDLGVASARGVVQRRLAEVVVDRRVGRLGKQVFDYLDVAALRREAQCGETVGVFRVDELLVKVEQQRVLAFGLVERAPEVLPPLLVCQWAAVGTAGVTDCR